MLNFKPIDNSVINNLTSLSSYRMKHMTPLEHDFIHVKHLSFNNGNKRLFCPVLPSVIEGLWRQIWILPVKFDGG
jgi:hypothetical protein